MSYYKLVWKLNLGLTLFSIIFISLFQLMVLYLVTTFDTQSMLASVLSQLPKNLRIFLNDSFFNMLSYDGAAAFGFNHPIVLALLAIVAIGLPVKHISREIENGNMEMMLSLPFRREKLIIQLWISGCLILACILLASFAGSILSLEVFHELSWEIFFNVLKIAFNLWLLYVLIMTYTLMLASCAKGGGKSGNISAMTTLIFYLLFFFGQIWEQLSFSLHFNIFNYYQPQEIMFGRGNYWIDLLILGLLTGLLLLLGVRRFERRDIP